MRQSDSQKGNLDGIVSLAKYTQMPVERIEYYPDSDTTLIARINYGILFIMAFWSCPSVKAFTKITGILNRLDPQGTVPFIAVDIDGAAPFYEHPVFVDKINGWGEIAWINDGVIQCTSGMGYHPECFEPNTQALMNMRAERLDLKQAKAASGFADILARSRLRGNAGVAWGFG
jgi:hypothetical protein